MTGPTGHRTIYGEFCPEYRKVIIEFGALFGNGDYGNSLRVIHSISYILFGQHRDTWNRHSPHFQARGQADLPLRDSWQHDNDTITAADPLR